MKNLIYILLTVTLSTTPLHSQTKMQTSLYVLNGRFLRSNIPFDRSINTLNDMSLTKLAKITPLYQRKSHWHYHFNNLGVLGNGSNNSNSNSVGENIGSFGAGVITGGVLGGGLALTSFKVYTSADSDNIGGVIMAITGGIAGYTIGNALGVNWFKKLSGGKGSFGATFLGSFVGLLAGSAGLYVSEKILSDPNSGGNDKMSGVIFFVGPPIGAIIGYNISQ